MKINRVQIKNFRNFKNLDVTLGEHAVIVGENTIGKSNFLYALRLVLDPSLPDTARHLQESDFWDGLPRPLKKTAMISISIDLVDFEDNEDLMAILAEHLVDPEPMTARFTYVFQPLATLSGSPSSDADYEFIIYGGDRAENRVGYDVRRRIPVNVLSALRDAEGDLSSWRRSPLRPLLDEAAREIDREELNNIASEVADASAELLKNNEISELAEQINNRLSDMVGKFNSLNTILGFTATDPYRLIREIRLFIDGGKRGVGEASLGSSNLLYLALKSLELEQLVEQGSRDHTFLGIEEPEAHLHPHLQRLVYRDFLRPRSHREGEDGRSEIKHKHQTILLTTHSPHIVSVSPLHSIILLRRSSSENTTEAVSTTQVILDEKEIADLERYIDVTRGEMLFAKGVILVEGDAEEYLVPVLGKRLGYNFDELGITVCSVSGTNFAPYVKLLGESGLRIPFAVLTDLDPQSDGRYLGHSRVTSLLKEIMDEGEYQKAEDEGKLLDLAPNYGIFLNNYTLEIDLFKYKRHKSMCSTLIELTENNAAKERARVWREAPEKLDETKFLKDIGAIGKGRFAQRLATKIANYKATICPPYIKEAIKYVAGKCSK
ncbi:putative ATP-dependent endonuclease of the OLD family [Desulfoscipio gibsoniae DSM 7213]|uniref:Putative ATP-dependent endonuclease of the OLD family n=1 Tax=Desulfoscipio gibsoniae DSM 7213 TaxID=767817 RepID=R4KCS3_9FIRM|nr:putative ATP-dependent endonuclease of the OLD family [Desulfoscipio gibsoniae DSM 7213]